MRPVTKHHLPIVSLVREARRAEGEYDPRAHGALCSECPCNGYVVVPPNPPASGQEVPDALIIGQDPGHLEVWQRKAFIGASGKKLNKVLERYGLNRARMGITNACLCLPNDEDRPKAMKCCAPRLQREIEALPKSVPIVPLGAHAIKSALGRKVSILKARGFVWKKDGREYFPTLHPAFVARDDTQYPLFAIDFQRLSKRIREGHIALCEPPNYHVPRSIDELKLALSLFKRSKWVSCDIETSREQPTVAKLQCIGISDGKSTVVVPWVPFFRHLLREFFKTKEVNGHNFFAFDSIVLDLHGIPIAVKTIQDTLIAHHGYASHFRQGMDHCCSVYMDCDPWKILYGLSSNDEKGQAKTQLSEEDLFKYNAHDSYKQAHLWMAMQSDIANNQALYSHDKRLAEICRDMQMNGVLVDADRRKELSLAVQAKVDRLYKEMVAIVGHEFSPMKPTEIRTILFEELRAPFLGINYLTEKTKLPSTGKKALEAYAMQTTEPYGQFAEKLGFFRLCRKIQATHIDRLPIERDGRVHPSWRSFATPTGRWGCRQPNLMAQKIPDNRFAQEPEYQIRSQFIAPKGHKYVSFDLEQVEPRMSAYLSGDEAFIAAVETGDIHTAVAQIIFENKDGTLPPEIATSEMAKTKGKPMRQVAKKCGLGISYGAGAEKIFETLRADKHKITYTQVVICLDKLQKKFKRYYDFVQENLEKCQKDGHIVVGFMSGRKRWLGHAPNPPDIANSPIQAGAADLMNTRIIELYDWFEKTYNKLKKIVKIVAQVHDQVIVECPDALVRRVGGDIKRIMSQKVKIGNRMVTFPIEFKVGQRWSEV